MTKKRLTILFASVVLGLGTGFGLASCGSKSTPHGPVCSYDADDAGCPGTGPDNDGNR